MLASTTNVLEFLMGRLALGTIALALAFLASEYHRLIQKVEKKIVGQEDSQILNNVFQLK
jgi:hypothetical protein